MMVSAKEVVELAKALDTTGYGALWDDMVRESERKEWDRIEFEEAVMKALDNGLLYEPIIGKLKVI